MLSHYEINTWLNCANVCKYVIVPVIVNVPKWDFYFIVLTWTNAFLDGCITWHDVPFYPIRQQWCCHKLSASPLSQSHTPCLSYKPHQLLPEAVSLLLLAEFCVVLMKNGKIMEVKPLCSSMNWLFTKGNFSLTFSIHWLYECNRTPLFYFLFICENNDLGKKRRLSFSHLYYFLSLNVNIPGHLSVTSSGHYVKHYMHYTGGEWKCVWHDWKMCHVMHWVCVKNPD